MSRWLKILSVAGIVLASVGAFAQDNTRTIALYESVEGTINAGESAVYTFSGYISAALSFRVEALSGDLDPIVSVQGRDGQTLISNDDYHYPASKDALLEAISLTALGAHTVTVSGFGDTAGDFRLTLLPGYSQLAWEERFDSIGAWEATTDDLSAAIEEDRLVLTLDTGVREGLVVHTATDIWNDYYARVSVSDVTGRDWAVGMTTRGTSEHYGAFVVNDRGEWRFSVVTPEGETVLRDWVRHPAIRVGKTDFTLGMMTMRTGYDFFYDGEFVGRVGSDLLDGAGQIGLWVGATTNFGNTRAAFDDLRVTVPSLVADKPIFPTEIMTGDAGATTQQLLRYRLISPRGELFLNLPSSSADYGRPGVNLLSLAQGTSFTNFAMGTTIYSNTGAGTMTGCGVAIGISDDTHYTLAYLDRSGGYGVSQRDGDTFLEGLYGENEAWQDTETHQLLVIVNGDVVHYYIDGQYVGALEGAVSEGRIANAVVNFEPVYTSCQFSNTWVWRWQ